MASFLFFPQTVDDSDTHAICLRGNKKVWETSQGGLDGFLYRGAHANIVHVCWWRRRRTSGLGRLVSGIGSLMTNENA